jgi:hypothetical protein
MTGNKLRFYLMYDKRTPSARQPEKYHVGLILTPKKPKYSERSVIYHAINPIDPITKQQRWKFDSRDSEPRRATLTGFMLLGKVPPTFAEETITELLRAIRIPDIKEEPTWRCHSWVLDALEYTLNNVDR